MLTRGCLEKTCSKCGTTKPVTEFSKHVGKKDGLEHRCKTCRKHASVAYRQANTEKVNARAAAYRAANPEKVAASSTAYRAANLKKIATRDTTYRLAHPEKIAARGAAYYARNAEKIAARDATRRALHPEAGRIHRQNRRALKKAAGGRLPRDTIQRLLAKQKGLCACCFADLRETGYHLDHIVALVKGGAHTEDNIQLLTPKCNLSKGAKTFGEYLATQNNRGNTHVHI